jgi:hypothetical protein
LKYCKGDLFYGKTLEVEIEKFQRVEADFKCFGKQTFYYLRTFINHYCVRCLLIKPSEPISLLMEIIYDSCYTNISIFCYPSLLFLS